MGLVTLSQVVFQNDKYIGKVYSPGLGRTFDCEISMVDSSAMILNVKAGFLSRNLKWVRVN